MAPATAAAARPKPAAGKPALAKAAPQQQPRAAAPRGRAAEREQSDEDDSDMLDELSDAEEDEDDEEGAGSDDGDAAADPEEDDEETAAELLALAELQAAKQRKTAIVNKVRRAPARPARTCSRRYFSSLDTPACGVMSPARLSARSCTMAMRTQLRGAPTRPHGVAPGSSVVSRHSPPPPRCRTDRRSGPPRRRTGCGRGPGRR